VQPNVVIVGGGSSALILATELNTKKYSVHLYESNKTLGRKFLVAGDGGLNLTHAEDAKQFIARYVPADFLQEAFRRFNNTHLRSWLNALGISTFVGSSNRVFPVKGIKPAMVLQKLVKAVQQNGVNIHLEHKLISIGSQGDLEFISRGERKHVHADFVVFSLGGASWPITGSKGDWISMFQKLQVDIRPFYPSNCAFQIDWPTAFIAAHHGAVFKNCVFSADPKSHAGEAVITHFGIEGSGVYPLSASIRHMLQHQGKATLCLDLKPQWSKDMVWQRLMKFANGHLSAFLKSEIKLSSAQIALLKHLMPKEDFLNPKKLAACIKQLPLAVIGMAPLDEAISSVGGIALEAIKKDFSLRQLPNYFVIGEMLDYDAPTGGYLLQSCFSMGYFVAQTLNEK
jgi:uncharacterized flavoprotein (TIGR03862 family)